MESGRVPETDTRRAQVGEAFGFVGELGFRIVDSGTYRLGNWTPCHDLRLSVGFIRGWQ